MLLVGLVGGTDVIFFGTDKQTNRQTDSVLIFRTSIAYHLRTNVRATGGDCGETELVTLSIFEFISFDF